MNNKQDFNNFFPTDNSSKTNMHYDIVASKFLNSIESQQRKKYYASSSSNDAISIVTSLITIAFNLIVIIFIGIQKLFKLLLK